MALPAKPIRQTKGKSSFVLMVGDDGAILVQMRRKRIIRRMFAQSPHPDHSRNFDEALRGASGAPITMLVDMMDQSYVRQTLPPVSAFSVGKIVKRRLEKDFSPDDIKGYIVLGRERHGRKDWSYLMASLASPPLLQEWINFAVERTNPFKGLGLTPLELQPLLVSVSKKLLQDKGKDAKPLEWQILVSHHKVGGFRQVVLRNGKLIFTRMAQLVGELLPDVIAGNVEQEMLNTLEYLKRLGLQDFSLLSVIIVASAEIKQALDPKNIRCGEYHFFTPYEMASLLALTDAAMPEDHFGDVVASAFVGKRSKLLLPMHTVYTRKLMRYSLYITGARSIGALVTLAILGWIGASGMEVYDTQQDIAKDEVEKTSLHQQLQSIKEKSLALPKQISMYSDVKNLSQLFDRKKYDALAFVDTYATVLQNDATINSYEWTMTDPLAMSRDNDRRQISSDVTLHLITPREPSTRYIANAKSLIDRIKLAFPNYDMTHTELPGLLSDNKELQTTLGDNGTTAAEPASAQIESVQVTLKGPGLQQPAKFPGVR